MRCPKCGYISFDHVDSCLKCNKDISKVSSAVEGTTYNVAPPSFLRFSSGEKLHDDEEKTEISFDEAQEDYDVIDPDLDVLVNDEEEQSDDAGISFGDELDGFGQLADEDGFELESNEDDEIDLGQFEDAFENEEQQSGGTEEIDIDLPDELADISDLSAPAGDDLDKSEMYDGVSDEAPAEKNGMDDFNLDLDLDQLDDDFSLTSDDEQGESPDDDVLGDLSLDDIGLSHTEETKEAAKKKEVDPMDMDADLDFDLDLGGISLDDK